ncbi:MAG: NUDIX domain-containing protein [Patescibacteria group bacterium]
MPEKNIQKEYFNPGVTVDIAIFTIEDGALKMLVVNRAHEPFKGAPALPGGFIHEGETSRDTALRVLADKAGVSGVYVEQLFTFDALDRDPRGQIMSVAYFALVPRDQIHIHTEAATENPSLITISALPKLAFDHQSIASYALKRVQDKIQYTNIAYSLLPKSFSLSQLQSVYETVLGKKLDKRNFRKKFLQLDLIRATKKKSSGGRQRPALLYKFMKTMPSELRRFF